MCVDPSIMQDLQAGTRAQAQGRHLKHCRLQEETLIWRQASMVSAQPHVCSISRWDLRAPPGLAQKLGNAGFRKFASSAQPGFTCLATSGA